MYDATFDFKEVTILKIIVKTLGGFLGINKGDVIYISPQIGRQAPKYIKTLLYHEICHCMIKNHEKEFYDLLDAKLIDGSKLNKELVERRFFDVF